jgi:hypothetical protein
MGGGAHSSGVVSLWILMPGEAVIKSFVWAALRVLSLVWPKVIVYVVGAFAKIAWDAISMIQVRLISQSMYSDGGLLFVSRQFCPEGGAGL